MTQSSIHSRYNPHDVTKQFEHAVAKYTGAPYVVATTSCTMALLLACAYYFQKEGGKEHFVSIPKRTYVSVPMSIIHAGGQVEFEDYEWVGSYRLNPYPIFDAARLFTGGMFHMEQFMVAPDSQSRTIRSKMICVSFHWSKTLGIGQGGAILTNDSHADDWLRRARFDGRTEGKAPKDDHFDMLGWHAYMSPRDAAEGLSRLALITEDNEPLPNDEYPNLDDFDWKNMK